MEEGLNKKDIFRWYDGFLLPVLPPVIAISIKLLAMSCRLVKVIGEEDIKEMKREKGQGVLYVSWHQRMLYNIHFFGRHHMISMISQSRDGEYISRATRYLGYENVRGSSTRGGHLAFKQLVNAIKKGATGGMFADGPKGPARIAKIGPVLIARSSCAPLVPVSCGYERCWILNSWDRYLIPKPFSQVIYCFGQPIIIPKNIHKRDTEIYRIQLEEELNRITRLCDEYFGVQRPWKKTKKRS